MTLPFGSLSPHMSAPRRQNIRQLEQPTPRRTRLTPHHLIHSSLDPTVEGILSRTRDTERFEPIFLQSLDDIDHVLARPLNSGIGRTVYWAYWRVKSLEC